MVSNKSKFPKETTVEIEDLEEGGCLLHFNFSEKDYDLLSRYADVKGLSIEQALEGYITGLRDHLTTLNY